MKKLLFGIFICFGLIFVMSHNVDALSFILDQNNYEVSYFNPRANINVTYNNTLSCSDSGWCIPDTTNGNINVQKIEINIANHNVKKGDVVRFYLVLANRLNATQQNVIGLTNFDTNDNYFRLLGYNIIDQSEYSNVLGSSNNISTQYGLFKVYEIMLSARFDVPDNHLVKLETSNYNIPLFSLYASRDTSGTYKTFQFRVMNYQVLKYIGSSEDEVAKKELESTENIENQTTPNQSQTGDGVQATNLIGAFSGFVSALGGLSATNCNLTLNFPDFAGGSRVVNVCQNKDKAGNIISVFSSLTLIIFYVPLAIRLLTMIYNEIRSFTNG